MEENQSIPALPPPTDSKGMDASGESEKPSKAPIVIIAVVVVILILLIVAAIFLLRSDNATTGRVRDVFIIFMALESVVIGVAMIVLIVQLATLINLLQNELKPIIHSTNETVNTLKGTVTFLSENLTQPVIQLNAYMAGIKTFFDVLKPRRTKR